MKNMTKATLFAALLAAGAMALAQGGGAGGGGGRQGGGRGMMQRFGGGQSAALIVNIPEVQTEIGLDDAQKGKLKEYADKQREEQRARMEEMRNGGGGGFDMEAMQKAMREQNEKSEKAIKEILKPEQWDRVWQIWVQNQGNRAILNEKVQKDLGFTAEQTGKVKTLQDQSREAMNSMREKMMNGEIQREEIQDIMTKQQKTMDEELGKIMTTEQAGKLKEMGGKAFKLPEQRRGGGGGGL